MLPTIATTGKIVFTITPTRKNLRGQRYVNIDHNIRIIEAVVILHLFPIHRQEDTDSWEDYLRLINSTLEQFGTLPLSLKHYLVTSSKANLITIRRQIMANTRKQDVRILGSASCAYACVAVRTRLKAAENRFNICLSTLIISYSA